MKTAGDILSILFDERFVKKAKGYSKLFDSWAEITAKNEIAAAADHSRIKNLDRGILLIEMDHPGWKQIIQTKQSSLLNDYRTRFPELDISGISLMLGHSSPVSETKTEEAVEKAPLPKESSAEQPVMAGYDAINDEDFRETLKKLGQSIAEKEKL